MSCNLILFKLMLYTCLAYSFSEEVNRGIKNGGTLSLDMLPSETNAKLLNLGSLLGYGNKEYYPSINRPSTGEYYPVNNYPPTSFGTNILGGGYGYGGYGGCGGYGGYGDYGGYGGLRQYYGYWGPKYAGQRNRAFGYYPNTSIYGLAKISRRFGL